VNKAYKKKILEDFDFPRKKRMIKYPLRRRGEITQVRTPHIAKKVPNINIQQKQEKNFDIFKMKENDGLDLNPIYGN